MTIVRPIGIGVVILLAWWVVVLTAETPDYILPAPASVLAALYEHFGEIAPHALITALEIVLGLVLGTVLGVASALVLIAHRPTRRWLMPVLVISQAMPVFALAPVLVLWFGYGLASKVAMATLIIYFPVTAAFFDGLRRTPPGWTDLAQVMGGSRLSVLRVIRIPAALPAFASGLRVAAAVAPIGAVVGEWVGASGGLGYLMLHANARLQIDLMFAALFVLGALAVALYFAIDALLNRWISWRPETDTP